ncbi:MAG TPA: winged helix-turn-helix domain-containing protein [Pyrinomonadaceae bacterium]|jgi:serine/threonine-protein kinase
MDGQKSCFYDFESFRIDTLKRQLLCDGKVLPLTSKAFATLLFLVRQRGETVTKEELMTAVWFDTAVEENNLTQQISTLRKALGEQARAPQFIITIPGQGYSFIAPVKESFCLEPEIALQEIDESIASIDINRTTEIGKNGSNLLNGRIFSRSFQSLGLASLILLLLIVVLPVFFFSELISSKKPAICILPFKSLDNNEKSSIFSDGIPSYVTAKIGNIPNMIVRPIDSSGKYYGQEQNIVAVGRDNNVDAVLTGSTLCEGESVQIIVHLWDVKNNRQIWAKVFKKNASDALNVQEAISEEIVSVLREELSN